MSRNKHIDRNTLGFLNRYFIRFMWWLKISCMYLFHLIYTFIHVACLMAYGILDEVKQRTMVWDTLELNCNRKLPKETNQRRTNDPLVISQKGTSSKAKTHIECQPKQHSSHDQNLLVVLSYDRMDCTTRTRDVSQLIQTRK